MSVTVTLGFRDRVRVKVWVSFRLPTFIYYVWPPVSVRVRVSLGFRDTIRVSFRVSVSVTVTLGFRDMVRVSLGFRDRVRVKVRVSLIVTFVYSAWGNVTK